MPTDSTPSQRHRNAVDHAAKLAASGALSPGDLAALRRGAHGAPATYWRVFTTIVEPVLSPDRAVDDDEALAWASLLQIIALHVGFHNRHVPLGTALAQAGLSDLRFERLLRARGQALHDQAVQATRFLTSKAVPADLSTFALLVRFQDGAYAEKLRRFEARNFFRTLHHAQNS